VKFLPAVNSDRNLGPYWSKGFAIHEPWIDEDHLAAVRKAIEALHRRALGGESELAEQCVFEKNLPAAKRGGRAVDPSENAVFILSDPSRFDPTFLSIFAQAPLIRLVKEALETDEVEIHFANITTKSPAIGSGISWHRDFPNSYICPESPQMLRTMICIDGMDEENGATHFVPGTHLDNTAASDVSPTDARIVKAVCAPGAVVAIHPLVLHGGSPNFSSKWRRNIVIQWGKRGERLVPGPRESITGTSGAELAVRAAGRQRS
jgi:ectoine hydroxylase-related dioxygenase (phytanoyl-CoA dioxygenase family)